MLKDDKESIEVECHSSVRDAEHGHRIPPSSLCTISPAKAMALGYIKASNLHGSHCGEITTQQNTGD